MSLVETSKSRLAVQRLWYLATQGIVFAMWYLFPFPLEMQETSMNPTFFLLLSLPSYFFNFNLLHFKKYSLCIEQICLD